MNEAVEAQIAAERRASSSQQEMQMMRRSMVQHSTAQHSTILGGNKAQKSINTERQEVNITHHHQRVHLFHHQRVHLFHHQRVHPCHHQRVHPKCIPSQSRQSPDLPDHQPVSPQGVSSAPRSHCRESQQTAQTTQRAGVSWRCLYVLAYNQCKSSLTCPVCPLFWKV